MVIFIGSSLIQKSNTDFQAIYKISTDRFSKTAIESSYGSFLYRKKSTLKQQLATQLVLSW